MRLKIKDITNEKPEAKLYLMYKGAEQKETKGGKPYVVMNLMDGSNEIQGKKWDTTVEMLGIAEGTIILADISMDSYGYTVKSFRAASEAEAPVSEFIPISPVHPEELYKRIMERIQSFKSSEIWHVVKFLYEKHKTALIHSSAAKMMHHNTIGGLLWHSYRMMKIADSVADAYPVVNRDLLVAGCLIHDIGKIYELETDSYGTADYTIDGSLFGHLYMGAEMLKEVENAINANPEVIRNLKHIILSHHGTPEMGAVTKPATMEAFLVSEIDMMDAKAYQFEKLVNEQEAGTMSEQRVFGLGNIKVYNHML